jgi:transketolase
LGKGTTLHPGTDAVLFAYGPVMLHEALLAADTLKEQGFSLKVVNMPWLNRVDVKWLEGTVRGCGAIFVVDNHSPYGGLGDSLLNAALGSHALRQGKISKFAVDTYPACGTPQEALSYHGLDGETLAKRIISSVDWARK